jgi:hypothetical protein
MKSFIVTLLLCSGLSLLAQHETIIPDLSTITDSQMWTLHNRVATYDEAAVMDAKPGDGLLWINDSDFGNGKIELDIKGKDDRGRSFVGLAFHGVNDSTFEAVYFRPFNFESPERNGHSVQYISHPEYPWHRLRSEHPEKYENPVSPVPDPDDWFHAVIHIQYPTVKVYVNQSDTPSLVIEQIGEQEKGWLGFWVGHNSEGSFRNLKIIPE